LPQPQRQAASQVMELGAQTEANIAAQVA